MSSKTFYAQSLKQAARKAVKLARSNQRLITKLELAEDLAPKLVQHMALLAYRCWFQAK